MLFSPCFTMDLIQLWQSNSSRFKHWLLLFSLFTRSLAGDFRLSACYLLNLKCNATMHSPKMLMTWIFSKHCTLIFTGSSTLVYFIYRLLWKVFLNLKSVLCAIRNQEKLYYVLITNNFFLSLTHVSVLPTCK